MSAGLYGETEARYAALSGLVHGARVLDLAIHDDARCIDALVTAGAASITVCAPDQVRRDLTTQNLELHLVSPLSLPLPFEPRAFDVVVCFDLIARIAQDPAWMSGIRSVLTAEGAIVIATSSADDAARILGGSFGVATVFAQTPLVGHMLYDLGAEELEPELDRTWADGADDEPTSYVVIFAPEPRHNEKLTMVQMPFAAWERVASAEVEELRRDRDAARQELTVANERNARGQWELEVAVNELATLRHEGQPMAPASAASEELAAELMRHRNDRASLEGQIADLLEETAAASAAVMAWEERLRSLEQELEAAHGRAADAEARALELDTAVATAQAHATELEASVSEAQAHASNLEVALAEAQGRTGDLEAAITAADSREKQLTAALASAEARVVDLEGAVAELHARLAETAETPPVAEDSLALDQARYLITELEAASERDQVTIAELQDTIAVERATAREAKQAAEAERDAAKRRLDDVQRALDMSRRRGDDLARSLDTERQQLAELKDRLETERRRADAQEKNQNSNSSTEIDAPSGQKAIDGKS